MFKILEDFKQMKGAENKFFLGKLELDYGNEKILSRLKKIASQVEWLKGWPQDKKAFWNGEAFMWRSKISGGKRELIGRELKFLEKKRGRNLDLGCGAYSYVSSVGFDLAERMLLLNGSLVKRVEGDLEEKLPFKDGEFGSVTMVFVLDYVKNYWELLKEVKRVLARGGSLVVVQVKKKVDEWHGQKVAQKMNFGRWQELLGKAGFSVRFYEKDGLGFFRCGKRG